MDKAWYQVLPKQYTYKGLEFFMIFPQDVIEKIKSSFIFKKTDVVVCTYPKCGECIREPLFQHFVRNVQKVSDLIYT